STQNSCIAGYQTGLLGVQWGIFHDTFAMDSTLFGELDCDNWWFEYTSGARPNGTNYVGQSNFYAYARLNAAEDPHNSSVQFTSAKPIPFFCDGQPVTYNWGAYDPDGDSLWWELDTAWGNLGANWTGSFIQYAGTYH